MVLIKSHRKEIQCSLELRNSQHLVWGKFMFCGDQRHKELPGQLTQAAHLHNIEKICKEATKSAVITQIDNLAYDKPPVKSAVKAELRPIPLVYRPGDMYNVAVTSQLHKYGQFPLRNTDECHPFPP